MDTTFDISTLISVLNMVGSVIGFMYLSASKIARLEVKVDTIWDVMVKRAMTDALSAGVAVKNSPIRLKAKVREWIAASITPALLESLRNLYIQHKTKSDNELVLRIQREFGVQIANEMCIPNDSLNYDTCLFIALELAKDAGKEEKDSS